jgi:hypothetical protein
MHSNDEFSHVQGPSLFSICQVPNMGENVAREARFLKGTPRNVSYSNKLDPAQLKLIKVDFYQIDSRSVPLRGRRA